MTDNGAKQRIILTGASGTGKTTLAVPLAKALNLPVIPELGRKLCEEMGYKQVGEIPDQEGFKKQVLAAQIAEENKLNNFVSDRSTIDLWVLWQRWNLCQAMSYDTEAFYDATYQQAKTYTAIIYVPPMFPPPEDGFRWTDLDYQKQIDRLVRMTLYDWQLLDKTCIVKALDVDKRIAEITQWLQDRS